MKKIVSICVFSFLMNSVCGQFTSELRQVIDFEEYYNGELQQIESDESGKYLAVQIFHPDFRETGIVDALYLWKLIGNQFEEVARFLPIERHGYKGIDHFVISKNAEYIIIETEPSFRNANNGLRHANYIDTYVKDGSEANKWNLRYENRIHEVTGKTRTGRVSDTFDDIEAISDDGRFLVVTESTGFDNAGYFVGRKNSGLGYQFDYKYDVTCLANTSDETQECSSSAYFFEDHLGFEANGNLVILNASGGGQILEVFHPGFKTFFDERFFVTFNSTFTEIYLYEKMGSEWELSYQPVIPSPFAIYNGRIVELKFDPNTFELITDSIFIRDQTPSGWNQTSSYEVDLSDVGIHDLVDSVLILQRNIDDAFEIHVLQPQFSRIVPDNEDDMLLVRNRWPTAGDDTRLGQNCFDNLGPGLSIRGQISKNPVSKFSNIQTYLSDDPFQDGSDVIISDKSIDPSSFRLTSPNQYNNILIDSNYYVSGSIPVLYVNQQLDYDGSPPPSINGQPTFGNYEFTDITNVGAGTYFVNYVVDANQNIEECDEQNNFGSSVQIEIDDFMPGQCNCPETLVQDGFTWNRISENPSPENGFSTAGSNYYTGSVYLASCIYFNSNHSELVSVYLFWQQNLLANKEAGLFDFCDLNSTVLPTEFEWYIPQDDKIGIVAYSGTDFISESILSNIGDDFFSCFGDRILTVQEFCNQQVDVFTALISEEKELNFINEIIEDQSVNLRTNGNETIQVNGISLDGIPGAAVNTDVTFPFSIQPGEEVTLMITLRSDGNDVSNEGNIIISHTGSNAPLEIPTEVIDAIVKIKSSAGDTIYAGKSTQISMELLNPDNNTILGDIDSVKIRLKSINSQTTAGIKPFDHLFTIRSGKSGTLVYDAFEGQFTENTDIRENTLLSGVTTFGIGENPDRAISVLAHASPLDIEIVGLEFQQGVNLLNFDQTLAIGPGKDPRNFEALPYITNHPTSVVVSFDINNKGNIPFKSLRLPAISGSAIIIKDENLLHEVTASDWSVELTMSNGNTFTPQQKYDLEHVLVSRLGANTIRASGDYILGFELDYQSLNDKWIIKSDDASNDEAFIPAEFANSNPLRILVLLAGMDQVAEIPNITRDQIRSNTFYTIGSLHPIDAENLDIVLLSEEVSFDASYTCSEVFTESIHLLQLYNAENASEPADKILILGDAAFTAKICGASANGCAQYNRNNPSDTYAGIVNYQSNSAGHELGHLLGLADTYKGPGYCPDPNAHNPISATGKILEQGNYIQAHSIVDHETFYKMSQPLTVDNLKDKLVHRDMMGATVINGLRRGMDRLTWDYLYNSFYKISGDSRSNETAIVIGGTIDKDNVVSLSPIMRTENAPFLSENDPLGQYSIQLLNDADEILLEHRFDIEFFVADIGEVASVSFTFYLPSIADFQSVKVTFQDEEIHTFSKSQNAPEIISYTGVKDNSTGRLELSWEAQDQDGDNLYYSVVAKRANAANDVVVANSKEPGAFWHGGELDAITFELTVSDGYNETRASLTAEDITTSTVSIFADKSSFDIRPNPFKQDFVLDVIIKESFNGLITIYNLQGHRVHTLNYKFKPGMQSILIDLSTNPNGPYIIAISDSKNHRVYQDKVIKL